ncbi:phage major capsid protein [Laceyella tengchongensis]|jgi:hypothetical protein
MSVALKVRNQTGKEVEIKTGETLRSYMQQRFKRTDSYAVKRYLASEGVKLKDVIRALGIEDINEVKVRSILENDGTKPLFNAIVEDGMRMGFQKEANWEPLVARSVKSEQLSQTYYYLTDDEDEYTLRELGQGAPIPVGTIEVGDQSVKMHKRGRGIEWTDESKSMNIDLVSLYFMLMGKRLGRSYEDTAVHRLLNGYFPDGSDTAPTIGIKSANNLTVADLFYAGMYMEEELGFSPKRLLVNRETASMIAEMKNGDGNYLWTENLKNGEWPSVLRAPMQISRLVPANRIVLVDTSFALIRYVYKEFGVEFERSAKTQVEGSYGTEISEFVPFEKNARLVITLDQARS